MKVDLFNQNGKKISKGIDLNDKVFSVKPNEHTIYLAVKSELAAKRQGTSSSKTRSEVSGGGAKPWKQKGTGRARVGSTRNPSRVHGGSAFGPEPRIYDLKVNKKVKNLARKSALSIKIKSNSFKVVDDLILDKINTKDFNKILNNLDMDNEKVTMVIGSINKELLLSSRNLNKINLVLAQSFSTLDIVNSAKLLFDKSSIEFLNKNLN
jgi:large subunit ribosomal protein L4